jgi:predicted enzyme related to lactoylglutathione lyase
MPRVTHFEITADDPERAVKFYSDVFGWFVEKWQGPEDYWNCSTGEEDEPGINGAIMRRPSTLMEGGTIDTIGVTDLDDALERVVAAGGEIVHGRTTVPYVGYHAYCRDTEGNIFGLMEADEDARP